MAKASTSGALETIAIQPFGKLLLSVVAIGLMSYALWRFLQAAIDLKILSVFSKEAGFGHNIKFCK